MTGAGYLFVLGVVVFAAGWLAKDRHDRYVAEMRRHELDAWQRDFDLRVKQSMCPTPRVIPPVRRQDWRQR